MRLYISSGPHVDSSISDRADKIEDRLGAPEIVFYEGDSSALDARSVKSLLRLFPIAPLLTLAFAVQVYIFIEGFGRLYSSQSDSGGRDEELVQELRSRYGVESREIDIDLTHFIYRSKVWWFAANWGILAGIGWYFWPIETGVFQILEAAGVVLISAYLLLFVLLGISHSTRNRNFAKSILEGTNEFDEACSVMGETHHAGVGRLLKDQGSVTVLNPEPEDADMVTKLSLVLVETIGTIHSWYTNIP